MKKIKLLLFLLPIISFGQDNFNDYNQIIKEIELSTAKKDDKKKKKVHRLEIGLNGGVNIANITDPSSYNSLNSITNGDGTLVDLGKKLGALYGGTIVYNFNRFLCIKGDFDIASKGFEYSNVNFIEDNDAFQTIKTGDIKQMLNYFDVPAFFHLGFGKKLKFDINFGPYMAFLLKNSSNLIDQNGNKVSLDNNAKEFAVENLDQIDWGWVGGAGIDYHLTEKISIGFDFLLEQGQKLLNGGSTFGDFKNKSLDFDFGVNFMLFEKKSKKPF
jgi:hypothetical protein